MDLINNLKELTDQINEKKKILEKTIAPRLEVAQALDDSFGSALDNLRRQIDNALKEDRLPELKLNLSAEKIEELVQAYKRDKEIEIKKDEISANISQLIGETIVLFRNNSEVLKDLGRDFWNNIAKHYPAYYFKTDKLLIKFATKEFIIPHRRFTEPRDKIIEEIAPLAKRKEKEEKLEDLCKERKVLEDQIKALEGELAQPKSAP